MLELFNNTFLENCALRYINNCEGTYCKFEHAYYTACVGVLGLKCMSTEYRLKTYTD